MFYGKSMLYYNHYYYRNLYETAFLLEGPGPNYKPKEVDIAFASLSLDVWDLP